MRGLANRFDLALDVLAGTFGVLANSWRRLFLATLPALVVLLIVGMSTRGDVRELRASLHVKAPNALAGAAKPAGDAPSVAGPTDDPAAIDPATLDPEAAAADPGSVQSLLGGLGGSGKQGSAAGIDPDAFIPKIEPKIGTGLIVGAVTGLLVGLLALAAGVRMAASPVETFAEAWLAVLCIAPRVLVIGTLVLGPYLALRAAATATMGGLVASLIDNVLIVLGPLLLLAIVAAALGARGWTPGTAWRVHSSALGQTSAAMLLWSCVLAIIVLPLLLTGWQMIDGPGGVLLLPLTLVVPIVSGPAFALTLWVALDGDVEFDGASAVRMPVDILADDEAAMTAEPVLAQLDLIEPSWVAAPPIDLTIHTGGEAGTWLTPSTDGALTIDVSWEPGSAPELMLADASGAWRDPCVPDGSGRRFDLVGETGPIWMRVRSLSVTTQQVRISPWTWQKPGSSDTEQAAAA